MIFKLSDILYIGNHIENDCKSNINDIYIKSILCISDVSDYNNDFLINNSKFAETNKNIILFSNIQLNNEKNYTGDYISCYNLLDSLLRYRTPVLLYCHEENLELPLLISSMILFKSFSLIGMVSIQEVIQHIKNLCNYKMDINDNLIKDAEIAMNIIYPFYNSIKHFNCRDC